MNKENYKILIYTDGSSLGNPGPGGYGIIIKTSDGSFEKQFSKGFRKTTNNRMELLAVIDALKKIKNKKIPIEIYTDSKYVSEAINKGWLNKWVKERFRKTKNPDLWKEFLKTAKDFDFTIHWIKGHNKHPENEKCDKLAVQAAKSDKLYIDSGFENKENDNPKLF